MIAGTSAGTVYAPLNFDWQRSVQFVGVTSGAAVLSTWLVAPGNQGTAGALTMGIYLAFLLLSETRDWSRWSGLALLAEFVACAAVQGVPVVEAGFDALGHVAGMLSTALVVRRLHPQPFRLSSAQHVVLLGAATALPGAALSAGVELLIGAVSGQGASVLHWARYWSGYSIAGMTVAPLVMSLFGRHGAFVPKAHARQAEAVLLLMVLLLVTHIVFSTALPLSFALLPCLVWIGLRFELASMTAALMIITLLGLYHTTGGTGPYASSASNDDLSLLMLQSFLAVCACGGLILSTVMASWRTALSELQASRSALEQRVAARTADLEQSGRRLREAAERFRIARAAARMNVLEWDIPTDALNFSDPQEWLRGPLPECGKYPPFKDQVHPDDREYFLRMRELAINTLRGQIQQFRIVRTDGVELHIESFQMVFAGGDGQASRMVAILRDVTAHKLTENALRESGQRLRTLLDALPDAVRLKDVDGRYLMLNRTAQVQLGRCEAELIGKTVFEVLPRELADRLDAENKHALASAEPMRVDRAKLGTSDHEWVDVIHAPVRDGAGKVSGLVSITRDVSERKAAEIDRLRQREEHFRSVVEQATLLIYRTDPHGNFTFFNSDVALTRLLGYSREQLQGKNYLELVHPDHREQAAAFHREQFRERTPEYYCEYPAIAEDGRTVWLGQHINVFIENSRIMYHQGVCRDITKRMMAQIALRESNEQLRRLAVRQEEMLEDERTKVAHDLHDGIGQSINLARIKLSDLMLNGKPESLTEAIGEVVDILDDARKVIRTLEFDLSPPVLRELGLEPALEWLVEQMHENYGLQVSLSDDEEAKPLGQASRAVVLRAVRELLINVARHAGTRRAHVDTQRDGGQLVVTISDEGCGFDLAQTPRGLGLAGIQERFAHLGGTVLINSAPAEGTVITLSLPLEVVTRGVGA